MAVMVARAVARTRTVARMISECSDGGEGGGAMVEWLWIGSG
jgi:hypothetical protein